MPKSEWEKMSAKERLEAYTEVLMENRGMKRAMRDLRDDILSLEARMNQLEAWYTEKDNASEKD